MKDEDVFTLNRDKKMLSGVCAGIADYFDIAAIWVRLLFVFAVFTWGPTILAYFILYLFMSKQRVSPKDFANDLNDTYVAKKIKSINYKKPLYKNKREGKIQGICYGIAQYFDTNPLLVRLIFAGSLFFGPFALGLYIILAFVLEDEPFEYDVLAEHVEETRAATSNTEQEKRNSAYKENFSTPKHGAHYYSDNGSERIARTSEVFDVLEQKLRRLEAAVTSSKFKLHSEFKRM